MLTKILKGVLLLLFLSSMANAATYTNNTSPAPNVYFETMPLIFTPTYVLSTGVFDSASIGIGVINKCINNTTSNCPVSTDSVSDGGTFYFYNVDNGEYISALFTANVGFSNFTIYNPAPTPPTTEVPLSPLGKLLLALSFMGASLMMLRRKGAKV